MNTWRPLEAEGQQKRKWDAIQALCFSFRLDHICTLCIHRWFSRRSPEVKGWLSVERPLTPTGRAWGKSQWRNGTEGACRWGGFTGLRTVCCPPPGRDESGRTQTPHLSVTPLHRFSLSLTFTSNILQLSPLHCPSPAIPQRVSLLLRTCLLSWSPHPNPTDWEKRGGGGTTDRPERRRHLPSGCRGILDLSLLLRFHEQQSLSGDLTSWMLRDP